MTLRVLIAPNSFKGSLAAADAAAAIADGVRRAVPDADCRIVPLADGGEGTVRAFLAAIGGNEVSRRVTGPLGDPVQATFARLGDGSIAIIEMAAASGLGLIPADRRNPMQATTYGTGELIAAAIDSGCREIIVGLGGSATVDGGAGAAQALGARLLDRNGRELPRGGAALIDLDRIDADPLTRRLSGTKVTVASDVDNPLCGPNGAAAVFAPQKGASLEMVELLDRALANFARVCARDLGRDVSQRPGAGAAGGLGAGLMAFAEARLVSGADLILEMAHFEDQLAWADLVFTGEGRVDGQTLRGKGPHGVAKAAAGMSARSDGVSTRPVVVLAGSVGPGAPDLERIGRTVIVPITEGPTSLEMAMADAAALVAAAAARSTRLFAFGADRTPGRVGS